jgi:ribonuclease-3
MQKPIKVEEAVGYHFKNKGLLEQALTHPSFAYSEEKPSYERLEFLGDAVLNMVTAIHVFSQSPEKDEAFLTDLKSAYVNRNFLQNIGEKLQLQKFVMAKGLTNYRLDKVIESLIGALYLDGGMNAAERFVKKFILKKSIEPLFDYKNMIKAIVWGKYKAKVHYAVEKEIGPPHERIFHIRVEVEGKQTVGRGIGCTKKEAEIKAAYDFLKKMKLL